MPHKTREAARISERRYYWRHRERVLARKKERLKSHPRQYKTPGRRAWMANAHGRRREWLDELKTAPCMDCGGSFPPYCMDFDHRDPTRKNFGIGSEIHHPKPVILEEISRCDLVCANCHRVRTHTDRLVARLQGKLPPLPQLDPLDPTKYSDPQPDWTRR